VFRRDRWWNREIERRERAWAAERAELIATICHLSGKPLRVPQPPAAEPEPRTWTPSPEQQPI
jgi:hypothetical protein